MRRSQCAPSPATHFRLRRTTGPTGAGLPRTTQYGTFKTAYVQNCPHQGADVLLHLVPVAYIGLSAPPGPQVLYLHLCECVRDSGHSHPARSLGQDGVPFSWPYSALELLSFYSHDTSSRAAARAGSLARPRHRFKLDLTLQKSESSMLMKYTPELRGTRHARASECSRSLH